MPIQQHPLPQDITSYRFRLIGDMTIKQFASLAICLIIAFVFYSFPLPFFFKWPLVGLFVLLGIGLAFVPYEGRPLDQWLTSFIRSIYSPTQFVWKQTPLDAPQTSNNNTTASLRNSDTSELKQPQTANPPQISSTNTISSPQVGTETPPSPQTITQIIPQPSQVGTETVSINQETTQTLPQPTPQTTSSQTQPISSIDLPVPFTPTTSNILVGLTIDNANKILDGVLIEIKRDNLTVRATKSNKLGQFMFARALENGLYTLQAEKDNYSFPVFSLELKGDIIKPLKIQSN